MTAKYHFGIRDGENCLGIWRTERRVDDSVPHFSPINTVVLDDSSEEELQALANLLRLHLRARWYQGDPVEDIWVVHPDEYRRMAELMNESPTADNRSPDRPEDALPGREDQRGPH